MTKTQIDQKERLEALEGLFTRNATLVTGSAPLKKRSDQVSAYLNRIDIQQVLQEEDSESETLDKQKNRDLLVGKTVEVSSAAYAMALDDETIEDKEDYYLVKSDFEGIAADRVWSKCKAFSDKVAPHKGKMIADYQLAPQAMDDLISLVNRFDAKKNSPQEAIQRRAGATTELANIFDESTPWINDDLIKFMRMFIVPEPEFHAEFLNAVKVQG